MIILPGLTVDAGSHASVRTPDGFSGGLVRNVAVLTSSSLPAVVVAAQKAPTTPQGGQGRR